MNKTQIQKLDITKFFEPKVMKMIEDGFTLSHKWGLPNFDELMLLHLLLQDLKVQSILGKEKVRNSDLATRVKSELQRKIPAPIYEGIVFLTPESQKILLVAFQEVKRQRKKTLGTGDILLAFAINPKYTKLFDEFELDIVGVEQQVEATSGTVKDDPAQSTPLLNSYSKDITDTARRGGFMPTVNRETEIIQISRILARHGKNNVLLIGERGVGKRTIVQGLANAIVGSKVPAALRGIRILELDLHSMRSVANSKDRLEIIFEQFSRELKENPNVLIFIEDFDVLFKFEESRELYELGTILKTMLIQGSLRVLATISSASYRKYVEPDVSMSKSFASIRVDEPNEESAIEMIMSAAKKLENYHNVVITEKAIQSAVYLSKRYLPEKQLPEKAMDILDESCSKVSIEEKKEVQEEDINEIISEKTGIPLQKITESEQSKLVNLESILAKKVVGQENAIKAVSESIRRSRAGLKDPSKPVGSFLFMGPTGVGKTELAKVLTKVVYGDEAAMIRIDMSEFSEPHTVQRLVGAPPGYIGYEEGGQLTNPVWERPYSMILLDEIEKANPKVFDVFLQVLDAGRLTDGKGRTVDFRNTIIIATSNIASTEILETMQEGPKNVDAREILMPVLSEHFRPEFINRFDAVVVFNPLSIEAMYLIARLNVDKITAKLKQRGVQLTYTDYSIKQIAESSHDPRFGARPLLRYLQQNVENMIAKELISGQISEGGSVNLDSLLLNKNEPTATHGGNAATVNTPQA